MGWGWGHVSLATVRILPMKALTQSIGYVKAILSGIPNSVMSGDNRQCHLSAL